MGLGTLYTRAVHSIVKLASDDVRKLDTVRTLNDSVIRGKVRNVRNIPGTGSDDICRLHSVVDRKPFHAEALAG